jgi:uncharacterized protein YkwD
LTSEPAGPIIYIYMEEPAEPGPVLSPARFPSILTALILSLCAVASAAEPPSAKLEKEMFELVNKDRKAHGKKPLKFSDGFAAVARAHSADMAKAGFFGHKSPTTGQVANRLVAAKLRVKTCGENVAKNYTVKNAEERLMNSPGHRANILRDVYSHIGIGIVRSGIGLYYITQVFGTPAPKLDLAKTHANMLAKLNKTRIAKGKLPFKGNATLNHVAAQQAAVMANAGKGVTLNIGQLAAAAGFKNKRLHMIRLMTWTPEEVATADALLKPRLGWVGIGLAENTKHKKLGLGIVWTVVIFTNE